MVGFLFLFLSFLSTSLLSLCLLSSVLFPLPHSLYLNKFHIQTLSAWHILSPIVVWTHLPQYEPACCKVSSHTKIITQSKKVLQYYFD